jgi:4-diphosphocytidyl-2-C-methyl-D-erythritol kinase
MIADLHSRRLRIPAFAKINLSLQVRGVRPDGYHELSTVFQTIKLHDVLSFSQTSGPFDIRCDDPACPSDRTNLIWKSAQVLWRAGGLSGRPRGVRVRLQKKIPMQAGLGGGSSNAAAALVTLSKLWKVTLSSRQLARLAQKLGADVAFFLAGGTALGEGAGDRIKPLDDRPSSWVVLVVPDFGVSTKEAYAWLDSDRSAGGKTPRSFNDLQEPVSHRHPEIADIVNALTLAGSSHAAMSGSGSAVFGLFPTHAHAVTAARGLERPSRRVILTRTVGREEYERRRFRESE